MRYFYCSLAVAALKFLFPFRKHFIPILGVFISKTSSHPEKIQCSLGNVGYQLITDPFSFPNQENIPVDHKDATQCCWFPFSISTVLEVME